MIYFVAIVLDLFFTHLLLLLLLALHLFLDL